jgi:glycosyltransferase involved in cell wall biosynthesis
MTPNETPFRFHILAVPFSVTRKDYSACAFTQKVLKFCKMAYEHGHTVYHYGHPESEVLATEKVSVTDNEVLQKAYGHYDWKKELFSHNISDHAHTTFVERAIVEVGKRKQTHDFLLMFWGLGHLEVAKAHPELIAIEPGIGSFNTPCAPFNIYESYSVMNYLYGKNNWEPRWYDAVVPNYFDLDDFVFSAEKGTYFAYLGRIVDGKGVEIAVRITEALGVPLYIAGQGDFEKQIGFPPPAHVKIVGYVEPKERVELLKGAKALFAPTYYNEPFGGVTIEALLCGTPIITSDWGAFAENNLHGITGYRCRTMEQFYWAAKEIDKIDRKVCRKWAEDNFSLAKVWSMYNEHFNSLRKVFTAKGFYTPNPSRTELDWMKREYPSSQ